MERKGGRGEKKRARMGVEKTPDHSRARPTPKKARHSTRVRALRDILNDCPLEEVEPTPVVGEERQQQEKHERVVVADQKMVKGSLTLMVTPQTAPSARWGHSLSMLADGEAVMIGGQGDKHLFCKDSIWIINVNTNGWKALETSSEGPKPEARMGHTAVYDHTVRCVYLYGGSKLKKWYSDMHVLDTDDWKWTMVKASGRAPTRAYHTCNLYRHELWIFGGVFPNPDPQPDGCSNNIQVYSPIEENWYAPIVMGDKPTARSGHSATRLGDKLVVFGGWDAPQCFNDLHILDLCIVEWSQPNTLGAPPSPRSWHGACVLTGNRMLVSGGYNGNNALNDCFIFNIDTRCWTEVGIEQSLTARAGHAVMYQPYKQKNGKRDQVLVFGGGDNEGKFFKDQFTMMIPFETDAVLSLSASV